MSSPLSQSAVQNYTRSIYAARPKNIASAPFYIQHALLQLRCAKRNIERAEARDPGSTPQHIMDYVNVAIERLEAVFPPAFKERL
jgi:hypothetical protein